MRHSSHIIQVPGGLARSIAVPLSVTPEHDEVGVQAVQAVPHVGRVVGPPLLRKVQRGGRATLWLTCVYLQEARRGGKAAQTIRAHRTRFRLPNIKLTTHHSVRSAPASGCTP